MTTELRLGLAPLPAPRPRFRTIRTKSGKTIASAYSPANYKAWRKEALALLTGCAGLDGDGYSPDGPVTVICTFVIQRPKRTVRVCPVGDVDNYVKALLDVLTEFGAWADDILVRRVVADKRWTVDDEEPHITFIITEAPAP